MPDPILVSVLTGPGAVIRKPRRCRPAPVREQQSERFSIAAYVKPRPDQLKPAHWVDDRRVVSGILHMLRCGARWRDCPPEYGPYTTIYNRFNRWSRQGIWLAMFEAVTGQAAVIGTAAIDSSHMKAHRSAAGGKGGPSSKPSAARAAAGQRRSMP